MKRKLSLIVFLGITLGAMLTGLTGCNNQSSAPATGGETATNAPVVTNAPAQ